MAGRHRVSLGVMWSGDMGLLFGARHAGLRVRLEPLPSRRHSGAFGPRFPQPSRRLSSDPMNDLKIFSGPANPALTQDICRYLNLPMGKI